MYKTDANVNKIFKNLYLLFAYVKQSNLKLANVYKDGKYLYTLEQNKEGEWHVERNCKAKK